MSTPPLAFPAMALRVGVPSRIRAEGSRAPSCFVCGAGRVYRPSLARTLASRGETARRLAYFEAARRWYGGTDAAVRIMALRDAYGAFLYCPRGVVK